MALTEQQRSEIYSSLAGTIGRQGAEFLMAQQPPGGWEQLATKRDLADLETKTQAGFVEIRAMLVESEARMELRFAEVKEQFAAVDTRFAELSDRRSRDVWAFVAAITVLTVSICSSVFLAAWQFAPT